MNVSKEEIATYFQELNISTTSDVLDKCLEMCIAYNIGAEDFCDQWYAFTVSNLNGALPTIDSLQKMERKEFQNNKEQSFSRQTLTTPKQGSNYMVTDESDVGALDGTYSTTPKSNRIQTPMREKQVPKTPIAKDLSESYSTNGTPSISNSEKFSQRSDSRSVQCFYGSTTTKFKRETDISISIKNHNDDQLTADIRYMYEIMGKKAKSLNNMTHTLGHEILKKHNLVLSEGLLKTHLGEMITYGRIVSDSDGKINVQSILLEGTYETNLNHASTLNIQKLTKYSLFPGQVAVVKGNNVNSSTFIAENIFTDAELDLPEEPVVLNEPMQIVVAAGPFTLQDNLSYEPLHDLLQYVTEHRPHVLILMGPFLERSHESIHNGGLAQTFDSFFDGLVENVMNSLQPIDVRVIVVSSQKDAHHHPVYPTPPYRLRELYPNLTFVPDPCLININGLVIGATTADVLLHISNFELYLDKHPNAPIDRMGRMASHILNQHSFYPLYPPLKEMCIDHELLEQFGTLPCKPHILVLPSNLRHFIKVWMSLNSQMCCSEELRTAYFRENSRFYNKNIQDCLVVNPERLTKGYVAGTFARIEISQGSSQSVCDRTSSQILRV